MDDFGNSLSCYRTWDGMGKGTGFCSYPAGFNYAAWLYFAHPERIADSLRYT